MHFNKLVKLSLCILLFSSFVVLDIGRAEPGDPEPEQPRRARSFSLNDFNNFMTTFFRVPSVFSWDDAPKNPPVPSRSVDISIPIPIPVVANPPTSPPACLGVSAGGTPLASLDAMYSGACSSNNPVVPHVSSVGYEGTFCPAEKFAIRAHYTGGGSSTTIENVTASLNAAPQGTTVNVNCTDLKRANSTNLTVPGKPLSGMASYVCKAGVWRLVGLSCSDYELTCPTSAHAFNYQTLDLTSYWITLAMTSAVPGASGPLIACASLGDPGAGQVWASGGLATYCDGAGVWQVTGNCLKGPAVNKTYPNCVGAGTVYNPEYIKAGIAACLNADSTKYYWMLIEGSPPDICPNPAGC